FLCFPGAQFDSSSLLSAVAPPPLCPLHNNRTPSDYDILLPPQGSPSITQHLDVLLMGVCVCVWLCVRVRVWVCVGVCVVCCFWCVCVCPSIRLCYRRFVVWSPWSTTHIP